MDKITVSLFGIPRRYAYALLDLIDKDIVNAAQLSYYQEAYRLLEVREKIEETIRSTYVTEAQSATTSAD